MDTDIRVSADLLPSAKFRKLKRILGGDTVEYLIALWSHVAKTRPDGVLIEMDDMDIAVAANYPGDAEFFVRTMISERWIDVRDDGLREIHDWHEHQPWVTKAPERSAKAQKAVNARWDRHRKTTGIPKEYAENTTSIPTVIPPIPSTQNHDREEHDLVGEVEPDDSGAGDGAPASAAVFLSIQAKDGQVFDLTVDQVDAWRQALPGVDVEDELRKAAMWHEAALPSKRKTLRGMRAFLFNWLKNDRPNRIRGARASPEPADDGFFDLRNYT